MIYERLEALRVDVGRLQQHIDEVVHRLGMPVMQTPGVFGGWSVQSATGGWEDGWIAGAGCIKKDETGRSVIDYSCLKQRGFKPTFSHDIPTAAATGYVADLLAEVEGLGLYPRRTRFSIIEPGADGGWHRDAPDDEYAVRLHIPIITNPASLYETEDGAAHFPADGGAFLINVNRMHRIVNRGPERRYHLMFCVWDTKGVSRHHRFTGDIGNLAVRAAELARMIDEA